MSWGSKGLYLRDCLKDRGLVPSILKPNTEVVDTVITARNRRTDFRYLTFAVIDTIVTIRY